MKGKNSGFSILMLPGIFLFLYIVIRAIQVPVTHDESNTILTYAAYSVKDIMLYSDPVPNNHIVNTLLIKLFVAVFGLESFVVRLPNVLGFIIYYFFLFRLVRLLFPSVITGLLCIVLLTCNLFLIDFFSLARGYALACAMLMASVYYIYLFLRNANNKYLLYGLLWCAIGVYTSFTVLNFYVALIGLLLIVVFMRKLNDSVKNARINYVKKPILIILSVTIVLAALITIPVMRMVETSQFVYWGQRNFYDDTLLTLATATFYGEPFLQLETVQWCFIFVLLFITIILIAVFRIFKSRRAIIDDSFVFFLLLALGTVIVNIAQFYIAGTPYLTSRTALFFIPVFTLPFIFLLADLVQRDYRWQIPYLVAAVFAVSVFRLNMNINRTFEWWYDADTKEIIDLLEQHHASTKETISLNTNWIFYPSFNFHIYAREIDWLQLTPFHTDLQTNADSEFYYATVEDATALDKNYRLYKAFGWNSRQLLIKRQAPLLMD